VLSIIGFASRAIGPSIYIYYFCMPEKTSVPSLYAGDKTPFLTISLSPGADPT
jgi:hypothetical protein